MELLPIAGLSISGTIGRVEAKRAPEVECPQGGHWGPLHTPGVFPGTPAESRQAVTSSFTECVLASTLSRPKICLKWLKYVRCKSCHKVRMLQY